MWQLFLGGENVLNNIRIFPFQSEVTIYMGNGK